MTKNYISKRADGLSVVLIGSWFIGDAFKTVYFIFKEVKNIYILVSITIYNDRCDLISDRLCNLSLNENLF